MFKKCFLYINFFFLFGCSSYDADIKSIYPLNGTKEFKEGVYLSDTWNIQEYEGNFYLNDYPNDRILITDNYLQLLDTIGKTGNGPGEFQGAGALFVYNDYIYVQDDGGMRMNVFDLNGVFERTFMLPSINLNWTRFAVLNDRIYLQSAIGSGYDMLILDLNGEIIKEINEIQNRPDDMQYRTIFPFQDEIIALHRTAPYIERFSDHGELLEIFDLTGIEEMRELWRHYRNVRGQNNHRNMTILFSDAYISDSLLYILCSGWPGRDEYSYIIKLLIGNQKIEVSNVFKIQGWDPSMSFFKSIAVKEKRMIALEGRSQTILEFDLSELK